MSLPRVLVGVGAEGAPAAVAFVAFDAIDRKVELELVHVLRPLAPTSTSPGGYPAEERAAAEALVEEAAFLARYLALESGPPVVTDVIEADRVADALARQAHTASLVVVERRYPVLHHQVITGSTVHGLCARSPVPVVVVPPAWDPPGPFRRPITVAVQDVVEAEPLMRLACVEAEWRATEVVVVHVEEDECGPSGSSPCGGTSHGHESLAHRRLRRLTDALGAEFPTVAIFLQVPRTRPIESLLLASGYSEVLIMGRRHHRLPPGSHLGPLTRAVLDRSRCPVMVSAEQEPGPGPGPDPDHGLSDAVVGLSDLGWSDSAPPPR